MDLIISPPKFQMLDSNGAPLASGKVNTYAAGGDTPETTYSDYALTTPNTNPVVLDSRGEAKIFCANALKLVITDSDDGAIYTFDNVTPIQLSVLAAVSTSLPGCLVRARFEAKDTDEIFIHPGAYHHQGTTEQIVYWDSKLTMQLTGMGNDEWNYIYIDDSAIVTAETNLLTATEFIKSTTAPTWSDAKHGWYNGSDRCIFAILTNGSAEIIEFHHDGGDYVSWVEAYATSGLGDIDTTWTATVFQAPGFALAVQVLTILHQTATDTLINALYRPTGASSAGGHQLGSVKSGDAARSYVVAKLLTNSSQSGDVKFSAAGDTTIAMQTLGWFFPLGM